MATFIQQSKLDVNLFVDRGADLTIDFDVVLDLPDTVVFGERAVITILNYDPFVKYTVSAEYGAVYINDDLIYYTAPEPPPDSFNDILRVDVSIDMTQLVYMTDETKSDSCVYLNSGEIVDASDSRVLEKIKIIQEEYDDMMLEAKSSVNVVKIPHFDYSNNKPLRLDEYDASKHFAEYIHLQRSWRNDGTPIGGVNSYHLPSDIDLKKNYNKWIYEANVIDGVAYTTFKSRNSNTNEAAGNTMDGYRYLGAIGSSLSVVNSGYKTEESFFFDILIDLKELEAILPDEILSLCMKSFLLEPQLRGDQYGHTFFWEQISGDTSAITWLSDPTDLVLVLDIGELKTDRVFRFWISRGTKYEKYYDVILYATPKDELYGDPNSNNQFSNWGKTSGFGDYTTKPLVLTSERLITKNFRIRFK